MLHKKYYTKELRDFQKLFWFKITNKTLQTRFKQQTSHTIRYLYFSKVSISQGIHPSHAFQFEQI